MKKLVMCALVISAMAVSAAEVTVKNDAAFSPGGYVNIKNINGKVTVRGWDKNEIKLVAVKKGSDDQLGDWKILFDVDGDQANIEVQRPAKRKKGWFGGYKNNVSIKMELWVPREVALVARTTNGGLNVEGIQGRLDAQTTNGKVSISGISGSIDARTTNGSVVAELVEHNGDDMNFRTTNGSIKLKAPASLAADFSAKTTNGSIKSGLPMDVSDKSRKRLEGSLNGGGAQVTMKTTNGSISITEI